MMISSDDETGGPATPTAMDAVVPTSETTTLGMLPTDTASVPTMPTMASSEDDLQEQQSQAYLQALHGLGMVPHGVTTPPGRTVPTGVCFRLSWPLHALAQLVAAGDGHGASPVDRPPLAIHTLAAATAVVIPGWGCCMQR